MTTLQRARLRMPSSSRLATFGAAPVPGASSSIADLAAYLLHVRRRTRAYCTADAEVAACATIPLPPRTRRSKALQRPIGV
ncbi:hypothetical protein OH76DRAFT_1404629 [Lentinus brumalis]|uniref:Uncharacterized protein n=1 Tax=Lentinus brumalis TaxID=2498619 RepID=A0A371D853_9APHY|nr:hypothetical protein OH76DRAFT_1404629 [Polyporus brumalis]